MGWVRGVRTGLAACLLASGGCDRPPTPTGPPAESGRVTVANRIRIYYEIEGQGDTLVLIHGGFADRRIWNPQVDDLSRSFTVIRYDLRGFGRSDFPTRPYHPSRDLLTLFDALHIGRATLVGLSMGGEVALSFTLAYPDRVGALLLASSPAPGLPLPEEEPDPLAPVFEAAMSGGRDSAVAAWLRHPMLGSLRERKEVANQLEFLVRENERYFTLPFRPFLPDDPPPSERLGEIGVPTVVMWGDQDLEMVQRNSIVTAERIPGARTVVVRGAGHLVNLERPSDFNRTVRDLAQRVED